ncbi:MAG: hypothetical protein BGO26_12660 [Actinobacteria bacterium 69-20]|nr:hypothetical protein [Actinomycetota bacterium]OJV23543.1 MAG: hypothetical protein BGO26_12660 [Actinobacteria bacterium 69-20]
MSVVDAIGWIAALSSASLAVPQGARIAMTRSVAGVSTTTWQTMLIAGIAWSAHGLLYGTQQIIWPNALLAVTSAWVLWQLVTAHKLPVIRTWSIPVAVAAVAFGADMTFGPLAFAVVAFVPGSIGQVSQLRAILRVPDPSGVSMVALLASLLNQVLWFAYALPAHEVAVLAVCVPIAFLVTASVIALWVRRRQLALHRAAGRLEQVARSRAGAIAERSAGTNPTGSRALTDVIPVQLGQQLSAAASPAPEPACDGCGI